MELDYKEIGKRVKIARIRADLTQEALAEKAGLSITHMSNIENGHSKLSLPMAVALANVLSVSVDEFLCDSVIHSKEIFSHEVQMLLEDCDDYEIRILTDLLKAVKDTIRRDMKLKQQGIAQTVIVDRAALLFSYNAKRGRGGCMPLRPALCFLCLPHREVWQFFQQLHNQVLLHILINGQLVDHGGIVFDHLFFGPFLAGDGGPDGSCVQ